MQQTKVKSISETYTYGIFDRNGVIQNTVGKILKDGERLTKERLAQEFLVIEKNFKYTKKFEVLEAFNKGLIQLYYAPDNVKLPTAMPFFLTKIGNDVVAIVSVDLYGSKNREGTTVSIDPKKLYCLMESAFYAIKYHTHNRSLTSRASVIRDGSRVYANMFVRVLNKKYALNVDKTKYAKAIFLASKFYMINMLELENGETVTNYAIQNCVGASPMFLREFDSLIPEETYKDLTTLIKAFNDPTLHTGVHDLTVRNYIEQFIIMYDTSTLFGLEYLPYFIYIIEAVCMKAYLNNQAILEDIVEPQGEKLYIDLARM